MDPEVHYVTDRDAGIALITGQIVEAWLARQPIKSGNVTPDQLASVIMATRLSLYQPIGIIEDTEAPQPKRGAKPNLRPVS